MKRSEEINTQMCNKFVIQKHLLGAYEQSNYHWVITSIPGGNWYIPRDDTTAKNKKQLLYKYKCGSGLFWSSGQVKM